MARGYLGLRKWDYSEENKENIIHRKSKTIIFTGEPEWNNVIHRRGVVCSHIGGISWRGGGYSWLAAQVPINIIQGDH